MAVINSQAKIVSGKQFAVEEYGSRPELAPADMDRLKILQVWLLNVWLFAIKDTLILKLVKLVPLAFQLFLAAPLHHNINEGYGSL